MAKINDKQYIKTCGSRLVRVGNSSIDTRKLVFVLQTRFCWVSCVLPTIRSLTLPLLVLPMSNFAHTTK